MGIEEIRALYNGIRDNPIEGFIVLVLGIAILVCRSYLSAFFSQMGSQHAQNSDVSTDDELEALIGFDSVVIDDEPLSKREVPHLIYFPGESPFDHQRSEYTYYRIRVSFLVKRSGISHFKVDPERLLPQFEIGYVDNLKMSGTNLVPGETIHTEFYRRSTKRQLGIGTLNVFTLPCFEYLNHKGEKRRVSIDHVLNSKFLGVRDEAGNELQIETPDVKYLNQ